MAKKRELIMKNLIIYAIVGTLISSAAVAGPRDAIEINLSKKMVHFRQLLVFQASSIKMEQ